MYREKSVRTNVKKKVLVLLQELYVFRLYFTFTCSRPGEKQDTKPL